MNSWLKNFCLLLRTINYSLKNINYNFFIKADTISIVVNLTIFNFII